ncbi:MRC [Mytilus coruscus]|uniref:MRC n=1 Tax=Mytilus coruscus TaxID=42192 RepID=A0A6J8EA72_MYTCO|nr:MRC [Mytilus coruscus]
MYFSEFPFSYDVPFYEDSVFCIYATFYLNNKNVGWVPSDCNDNYLNSIDCCYDGQHNTEAFNATLYAEAVTWYTAENYCSNEGSYLVNLTQSIGFHFTFVTTPWLSSGVTKFWTGHYSTGKNLKDLEIAEINGFGEVENNQTGCVYVSVESRYHNFPKLKLATDSCRNAMYGFICLKPTKYRYFDRTPNLIYISNYIKYDGQPYTFTECEDECLQLTKKGYACIGFNYNIANSSCRFKETVFNGNYHVQYDPGWVSVDYTYVHVTNNEGITALSYLYDRNDQATLPSEKTNIRDSDNTSDHTAATEDINIDTTVLGERCHIYLA